MWGGEACIQESEITEAGHLLGHLSDGISGGSFLGVQGWGRMASSF